MDADRPQAATAPGTTPAQLAKGALRRLAQARQEPTPANFARAYAEEAGSAAPAEDALPARARPVMERLAMRLVADAAARGELVASLMAGRWDEVPRQLERAAAASADAGWPALIARLTRALERGGRTWTVARKKDGLQRLLDGPASEAARLPQRLQQLLAQWENDPPGAALESAEAADAAAAAAAAGGVLGGLPGGVSGGAPDPAADSARAGPAVEPGLPVPGPDQTHQPQVLHALQTTVRAALPEDEPRAQALADELAALAERVAQEGATADLAEAVAEVCHRVRRVLGVRQDLVAELLALTRSLTEGITELAEDGSWAHGQGKAVRQRLNGNTSARAVRAARALLDHTRDSQRSLQREREAARDALKQMVQQVLTELVALEGTTGGFSERVGGYAAVIANAPSLDSLGQLVREMLTDSQAVQAAVAGARDRLAQEHARAASLEQQVRTLESDLRRLSDEVSTDALTQVANRRGMQQAFEAERARVEREAGAGAGAGALAVGLIDIDNFKKLNDSLGHAAGDVALKSLAARVKDWLRPVDHVARFGGEEFVVLLPDTPVDEAQQVLTRLQRKLSASLFMHEGKEVFVTFSAGVTAYRVVDGAGEPLDLALARADEGLYEAKRTGKNRTCIV